MSIKANHHNGSVGITISNSIVGSNNVGVEIHAQLNSYSHKINANGGYWDAQLTIAGNMTTLLPTIDSIIGSDVRTVSREGEQIWNGFVNQVDINIGGIASFTVGPLMGVRNNLSVVFQTTRYNTNPPIGGQQRRLDPIGDSQSQDRYGIIGHELSGGTGDTASATVLQNTHLNENKKPRVNQSLTVGSASASSISVNLQCLGYVHFLDKFIYTNNTAGNTIPETKIDAVISSEPNGLFINSILDTPLTNNLSIPYAESGSTGWAVIKSIVSLGDAAFNRYTFGITENRDAYYYRVPTNYTYFLEPSGIVKERGVIVEPWLIKPGLWMDASSLVYGGNQSSADIGLGERISDVFIESISFTAPNITRIEGGKVDRSIQQLAQRGIGGAF